LTLAELIARVEQRLAAANLHYGHGTDSPHDEAAWLVLRGLGLPFDADLSRAAPGAAGIDALVKRRVEERLPAAYLLREAWLEGQPFYVDERVIVPRSHIAGLLRRPLLARRRPGRILDLCTGSGCLAILAARAFPSAAIDAVDLSAGAVAVARKNVARHRLGRRVRVLRSDLFSAVRAVRYDLILSNPPYVSQRDMRTLPAEYRHEPRLALAGGGDGLDLVARIIHEADRHLEPKGMLVCEVGDGRAAVKRRFPRLRLAWPVVEVFSADGAALASAASKDAASRARSIRAPARR
jgi:ribosomal protein L3 glutamine methyltransferase